MCEPLKNKLHKLAGHPHMESADNNDVCAWWFHKNDVKSAVEGLITEILDCENNDCVISRCDVVEIIKKWFEDVI